MDTTLEDKKQERQKDPDSFTAIADDLKELQQICVEKIQQAAKSGGLKTHPKMMYILYQWREWVSPEEPRKWVENLIESKAGLLTFLAAFLQRSTSSGAEDYVSRIYWYISLTRIEDFISVNVLEEKVGQLSLAGLGEKERRAVSAFHRAVKRSREGRSDDDWLHDEDGE